VSERGFGFIDAAYGKANFSHRSGMDASVNFDSFMGGEKVIFDIEPSRRARTLTASGWHSQAARARWYIQGQGPTPATPGTTIRG